MKTILAATVALLMAAPSFASTDYASEIKKLVAGSLRAEIAAPVVLAAIREQNAQHAALDQAGVDAMDLQWRAEIKAGDGPMVQETMANAISDYLKGVQAKHGGLVTEIFVMDYLGLNVGQSERTSDYWQGDEAKFQKSYGAGPAALFVDEVEFDESTQTMQSQASFTLVDPATGAAIGAVTVGFNVDLLTQ